MPPRDKAQSSQRTPRLLCALCVKSFLFLFLFLLAGCGHSNAVDPASLTFLIESNPTNLDPRIDALVDQIRTETDREKRKVLRSEVQKILADDPPCLPLWFADAVSLHRRSLSDLALSAPDDYDFLAKIPALEN
jgi:ABC-type transport system substrate-binding protein